MVSSKKKLTNVLLRNIESILEICNKILVIDDNVISLS